MPVIFSRSCEYAIQAVLYIAKESDSRPIQLKEVASALHIPLHYLSKILQSLVRSEIIQSFKGKNGGFVLSRPSDQITLGDIVLAIDGTGFLNHCVLGFTGCQDDLPCPVHEEWKSIKQLVRSMVSKKNVHDLGKEINSKVIFLELLSHKQQQASESIS
jgi:Rrf2 family protein